jgi:hypothetical protein
MIVAQAIQLATWASSANHLLLMSNPKLREPILQSKGLEENELLMK